eukprot:CAMPEP_0172301968 /NCGR_PEP_ID=MMETSP1058-20130122/3760_1 /TAXON_ID=83371 /ORGANISM="Detonula confervacea, Strain CCMP 353" /LENGTH=705 /DNA_ID=CAMNT_0013012291 /DNA_START=249 /DNA_END=2366 /DNA_ORIENTATION=+
MSSPHCIFAMRVNTLAILFTLGIVPFLLTGCHAFAPTPHGTKSHTQQEVWHPQQHRRTSLSPLQAVTKRQTLILDGAELAYYLKSLAQQTADDNEHVSTDGQGDASGAAVAVKLPNLAPRSPQKRNRIGAITFVTAILDKDIHWNSNGTLEEGTQIIGVEVSSHSNNNGGTDDDNNDDGPHRNIISINDDLHLYQDSIAIIPPKVSPSDAISTAATSLLGVHCSSSSPSSLEEPRDEKRGKNIVIVGGGDYALFLTKALVGLGNKVSLVSARPSWSLPSPSDISKMSKTNRDLVEIVPPAVGPMALGFAMAIGEFDILIDTLGDELGIGRALSVIDNENIMKGGRFLGQLKELHGCDNYLSTLTRSQQYVLKKGLLFARDPVIRYQKEVEKLSFATQGLPPPSIFGRTLQLLLDQDIIYSSDHNENGKQETKTNFVRGWSLSDITEDKTWPREGNLRFGFPSVDLSSPSMLRRRKDAAASLNANDSVISAHANDQEIEGSTKQSLSRESKNDVEATEAPSSSDESVNHEQVEEDSITTDIMFTSSTPNTTIKVTKRPSNKSTTVSNPHVTTIHSVSDLNKQIIEPKRNCILFLTASYCQKCKRMTPQFNRLARMSLESKSNVLFAHVDISNGPRGKQLGNVLGADKVPSVIVFEKGERVKLDGDEASTVVERNNMSRLEDVVKVLERGEGNVNVNALLSSETAKK